MPAVLLVAHHYPPHVGGLELVVQRQAQGMAANGYTVRVLTSQWGGAGANTESDAAIEVRRVACWHVFENLLFIPFPLFSPSLIREARKQVKQADIVHVHDVFYVCSWVAALFAAIARKPLLLTQHVAIVEHSSRFVMGAQRLVYATIGKWIFSRARSIFVYNENVRSFLLRRGVPAERILFLANGVDTRLFRTPTSDEKRNARPRFGLPPDRPLVLFVGRLVEKKGLQILLQAKDPAFDLVFAGSGAVPAAGRVPGVHWLGPLSQADLAELHHACDVFAFPAVGEIFTLVMQEAMASGVPVVTTDDPAYSGSFVADSCVVCPRDPDSFRNAIKALLADPGRRAQLSERSRQVAVRRFDWRANFGPMLDAYADFFGPLGSPERKA